MKNFFWGIVFISMLGGAVQAAPARIRILNNRVHSEIVSRERIVQLVQSHFAIENFRLIQVLPMRADAGAEGLPYLVIELLSKQYHRVDVVRMNLTPQHRFAMIQENYQMSLAERQQQYGVSPKEAHCPDPTVEFLAIAPNDNDLELSITRDVADAASSKGLKVASLLVSDANHDNVLNYLTCPNLKGTFYDGDANTTAFTVSDGLIDWNEITDNFHFQRKVTHIWLACQAFNDPMKSSMITSAESQKYAAGVNNLLVGPSDKAAACAMKAALEGQPMTASFDDCYKKFDVTEDHWGFDGTGSDFFGK
jgi:hypothetical protein